MPTTVPDSHHDLLTAPVASLTTLAKDGSPRSSLIWFAYDEEKFKLSLSDGRLKTRDLLKRPQVSLLILDPDSAMRYLDIRGTATAEVDTDYAWADAHITPKYGADVRSRDAPGEVRYVVTIEPASVYAPALG